MTVSCMLMNYRREVPLRKASSTGVNEGENKICSIRWEYRERRVDVKLQTPIARRDSDSKYCMRGALSLPQFSGVCESRDVKSVDKGKTCVKVQYEQYYCTQYMRFYRRSGIP